MLVGISGQKGVGKDTAAAVLIQMGFVQVALADPIKRALMAFYGFTEEQLWGPSWMREDPDTRFPLPGGGYLTARDAAQRLGTEFGRKYPNTWIDLLIRTVEKLTAGGCEYTRVGGVKKVPGALPIRSVVTTDIRFENELHAVHAAGGMTIRILRPDLTSDDQHVSEREQLAIPNGAFTTFIVNNGSVEDLQRRVKSAVLEHALVWNQTI